MARAIRVYVGSIPAPYAAPSDAGPILDLAAWQATILRAAADAAGLADQVVLIRGETAADLAGLTDAGSPVLVPGVTYILNPDFSTLTVANPVSNANMWYVVGAQNIGNNTVTFDEVSVVTDGSDKVLEFFNAANLFIDSSPDPAGMSMWAPLSQSANEATIKYSIKWLTPTGTVGAANPWGKGGKLPGLCGTRPGQGVNPPSGGSPSIYGWSARNMWITPAAGFSGEGPRSPVELVGYLYHPQQAAGSFGINKRTGVGWLGTGGVALDAWVDVEMYHKMNTVTTEGSATPPADGIYSIFWTPPGGSRTRVFHDTAVIYRRYAAANATHLAMDKYYGGGDATWAPTGDTRMRFKNLQIIKHS